MTEDLDTKLLTYIRENPGCTNRELCVAFGYKTRGHEYQMVYDHTRSLVKYGFIEATLDDERWNTKHFRVIA